MKSVPFSLFSGGSFYLLFLSFGFNLLFVKPNGHTLILNLEFIQHVRHPQVMLYKSCPHHYKYLFILNHFIRVCLKTYVIAHLFHCTLSSLLDCMMLKCRDFTCFVHFFLVFTKICEHIYAYTERCLRVWKFVKWKDWRDNETRLKWVSKL